MDGTSVNPGTPENLYPMTGTEVVADAANTSGIADPAT
jgi:hypothetical protein